MKKRKALHPKIRMRVLALEPLCRSCGAAAHEIDHIIPVADGGGDNMANLQPLCRECHFKKTSSENRVRHRPELPGACVHGVPVHTECRECQS